MILAEGELSASEIKALFSNVSFDMYNHLKEKGGRHFAYKNGKYIQIKKNGKKKRKKWFVDEHGRFCKEKNKLFCGKIISIGGGEYHWYMNNFHTHTMSNFRKLTDD